MDTARRDLLLTALWTVLVLVAADVAIGRLFPLPADPRQPPSPLATYFHYGASIESKLRRLAGVPGGPHAPVAVSGWLEPFNADGEPLEARPGTRLLAVYGQSFAFQVARPMTAMDTTLTLRTRGGPASPASHGYALWSEDRGRVHADVAVLGILASSVQGMDANSAATWQFESPTAYTYPRFRLDADGRLVAAPPAVRSLDALRATLADAVRWRAWVAQVARDDDWYDPLLWRASWLDHSTLARLLRRAWAQREQRAHLARLHDRRGFREDAESVRVLRAIVASFADGCRSDRTLPIVLLLEDAGYGDHLSRLLGPQLDRLGVAWLGTHAIADPGDAANLKPDGHFVAPINQRLAAELLARIHAGLAAGTTSAREGETARLRPTHEAAK